MLRIAGIAALVVGGWYLFRGRKERSDCYRLRIVTADGAATLTEPRHVSEAQGIEWETDAREANWGATVERVSC